jgi:uncharacterized delta-60 repeat protein
MKYFKKFIAFDIFVFIFLIVVFNSKVEFIKAGTIDESFKAEVTKGKYGENVIQGEITDVKQQPDGKLIIAGNFIYFNNDSSNKHIIRIFPDGTLDTSFHSAFQFEYLFDISIISTIFIQNDGKILVGGRFESVEGRSVSNFVRLLPNGRLDTSFQKNAYATGFRFCGNGIPPVVHSILRLNESTLLLTGDLTEYDNHYVFMAPILIDRGGQIKSENYKVVISKDSDDRKGYNNDEFFNVRQKFLSNFFMSTIGKLDDNVIGIGSLGKIITFGLEGIIAINQNGTKDSTFQLIPMYSEERGVLPKVVGLNFDLRRTKAILLPNDMLLVCGKTYNRGVNNESVPVQTAIVRYFSNGAIDSTFKIDSAYLNNLFSTFYGTPLFADNNGRIIIGNKSFNQDGSLYNSFLLPFNDRYKIYIDSKDSYLIAKENVLYKVSKYPKINFFDLFSITLKN